MSERSATGDWRATVAEASADWPAIPGYELLAELGRGGMGVVFKARQSNANRVVALKVLRNATLATPQERARFHIETEAVARLHHDSIAEILEVGEHQGQPFFAMELVEGGTLEQFIGGQPRPATQSAELVCSLAKAIQHAHEAKVVHRDLKPANILLGRHRKETGEVGPEGGPIPKIVDFGLAKRLDCESTALTHDGAVLGTASYMAPEQAAGRVRDIGPATDVYALGAILYEMLTGRPPFHGDSWNQTLQQVLNDDPPPPTRVHADVPRDLETICLKCLEKEPGRRYETARNLAEDLERFLAARPIAAAPLGEFERVARMAARDGNEVVSEIGRGPRSVVYRALDGPMKQPVALKVDRAGTLSRDEWEARLQRSSDLWSALAHPHIVAIKRAGWWDGVPYLVEEYVAQGSLDAQLSPRPYPVPLALRLVEQLAEIIIYVHRQGIVHGNLKPSNVLLAADGIPRIVDFRPPVGLFLARAPIEELEPAGLEYLAPELIAEPDAELRPHTDIYGLGAILYRLLAGQSPFAGSTPRETIQNIRARDPVPLTQLNRDVSPHLDAFCLRCLRKYPWRRYYRTYDVLKLLREFQQKPEEGQPSERGVPRPPRAEE